MIFICFDGEKRQTGHARELISFISSLSIGVEFAKNNMIGIFGLLTYVKVYFNYIFNFAINKIVFYWKN